MLPPPLYPDLPAPRSFMLPVGSGHVLHVQEWGRADGLPALVLHGGPGSGCSPLRARFFDPHRYRVICPDQRGSGRSTPAAGLTDNTTAHLLADLRELRRVCGIARWLVVGGSWGAALALAHALDQPEAMAGLLLRSTFLSRASDIDGFFHGAPERLVQGWRTLPEASGPQAAELAALWHCWEQACSGMAVPLAPQGPELAAMVCRFRVQSHYLRAGCWLQAPGLLERSEGLPQVPTLLLHGTEDLVCRPEGALALRNSIPHSRLRWAERAGHDPAHPAMVLLMVDALDSFAAHGSFDTAQVAQVP